MGGPEHRPLDGCGWERPFISRLVQEMSRPTNWDSYGANRVKASVVRRVIPFVAEMLGAGSDEMAPEVYALNCGGIDLVWRQWQWCVEIEFLGTGEIMLSTEYENGSDDCAISEKDTALARRWLNQMWGGEKPS